MRCCLRARLAEQEHAARREVLSWFCQRHLWQQGHLYLATGRSLESRRDLLCKRGAVWLGADMRLGRGLQHIYLQHHRAGNSVYFCDFECREFWIQLK